MKSKNKIILLVVIGILLVASITVFIVTRNKAQAAAEVGCVHCGVISSGTGECTACGKSKTHIYGAATCTKPKTCTVSGCTVTTGEPLGHKYEWNMTSTEHIQQCTMCKKVYEQSRGNHTYDSATGTCSQCGYTCSHSTYTANGGISATCQKEGTQHRVCKTCNYEWNVKLPKETCTAGSSYDHDSSQHWKLCKWCNQKVSGTNASHSYSSTNNTCVCGAVKTTTHTHNWIAESYTPKDENTHTTKYKCGGCSDTKTEIQNHTGDPCVCGYVYDQEVELPCDHRNGRVEYVTDQGGGHVWLCYDCNRLIIGMLWNGTIVQGETSTFGVHHFVNGVCRDIVYNGAQCNYPCQHPSYSNGRCIKCGMECIHTGGTHSNNGKCNTCGTTYQIHSQSTKVKSYTKTETKHTPIYECTFAGCSSTYTGTEVNHVYDKENNTKCVCGAVKATTHTHTWSTNPTSYTDKTGSTHTPVYKCTGCDEIKKGTSVAHVYNQENNTKCVCGATKVTENPTCEHNYQVDKTGATETQHWEKCTKCGDIRNRANHTYDKATGKCTICEYECKHTNKTQKKDDRYHWDECDNCGKEIDKKEHTYTDGKCDCGTKDPTECKHTNREWGTNETEHWHICKDCGKEISGTRERHIYENGKCSKCGKVESSKDPTNPYCKHINRETKSDNNEHWEVCKDCGKEIPGTREKHTFENGKCKDCGIKDSNSGKLPNTGVGTIMISIVAVSVLVAGGVIGVRKYKDI